MTAAEQKFDWPLCHDAENFLLERIDAFLARNTFAKRLSDRMLTGTGTLLLDWVDHLVATGAAEAKLRAVGFVPDPVGDTADGERAFWHPEAMLPRVLLSDSAPAEFPLRLAIRVDSITDFMAANGITGEIDGEPLSRFRRVIASEENGTRLEAIERRGYRGFTHRPGKVTDILNLLLAHELWKTRPRTFRTDAEGWQRTHALLDQLLGLVGRDLACHVFFWEERAYWQRRNRAARVQKERQDGLGLGWAKLDHELLREQLDALDVKTMKPFSDFPFLKQAFTEGERWPVRRERAERLLREGWIDEKQFRQFTNEGAIGSHLENLQRKGGFKGFNQKSVSVIIAATDPRLQAAGH